MFAKEYIDKIFFYSGYTYQSDFINSNFFKKIIIPNNSKKLTKITSDLLVGSKSKVTLFNDSGSVVSPFWIEYNRVIKNIFTIEYTNNDTKYPKYKYTSPETVIINLEYKISAFINHPSFPNHRFRYGIKLNDTNINYKEILKPLESGNIVVVRSYTINDTITAQFEIKQNDYLWFPIEIQNVLTDSYIDFIDIKVTSVTPITADLQLNDFIDIKTILPKNILQKDFFTWILKMFNLYVTEDKLKERHLLIEPYVDYYDTDAIDWTYKLARDKPWQIKPMGMLNGRFFEYKYKSDNDFYNDSYNKKFNQPYGTRLQDTGFQFAKSKQTLEIGFSPTPLIQYDNTDKIVSAIFKKTQGSAVGQEELIDSNIRILMAKKMTVNDEPWFIKNGTANLGSSLTSYGYAGHFDDPLNPTKDINFGAAEEIYFDPNTYPSDNLFNTYWSEYIAEIADKDSKILSCYVHLTPLDIAQLDFSKPVMIDGVKFRINKIEDYDYTNNDLVKVELLKVINNG